MTVLEHALPPVLQRLRVAANCLEDAQLERDAAIADSVVEGRPVEWIAEIAGIPANAVLEIARAWSVTPQDQESESRPDAAA